MQYEIARLDNNAHIYFAESYSYGGSSLLRHHLPRMMKALKLPQTASEAKTRQIKMYYQGTDRFFDFGITLRRFLTDHAEEYGISTYSYTYYPFHGVADIEYK